MFETVMKLFLNADDFGGSSTINTATNVGFREGWVNRASIMINKPCAEDAIRLASSGGYLDCIGLHINLSSGTPLSEQIKNCPRICNEQGDFHGKIFRGSRIPYFLSKEEKNAISIEIKSQMVKYLDYGHTLLHLDSHGHVHTYPSIQPIVMRLCREMRFRTIRISMNVGINRLKLIYKIIQNYLINNYNKVSGEPCHCFSDFYHFKKEIHYLKHKRYVEIMLHPDIRNDLYYIDAFHTSKDIISWISSNSNLIDI